jgi:hypothetical protein
VRDDDLRDAVASGRRAPAPELDRRVADTGVAVAVDDGDLEADRPDDAEPRRFAANRGHGRRPQLLLGVAGAAATGGGEDDEGDP